MKNETKDQLGYAVDEFKDGIKSDFQQAKKELEENAGKTKGECIFKAIIWFVWIIVGLIIGGAIGGILIISGIVGMWSYIQSYRKLSTAEHDNNNKK